MSLTYAMTDGLPGYRDGTALASFLRSGVPQLSLPQEDQAKLAHFFARSLGTLNPDTPDLYRANLLAAQIVELMRSEVDANFIMSTVEMEPDDISGSAVITAILPDKWCYHSLKFLWQVD